ncbi:hypothetical protein ACLB2K_042912 [Fragaria x ananassa]
MRKTRVLAALVASCLCFIVFHICVSSATRFINRAEFSAETPEITRGISEISKQSHHPSKEIPIICDRTSKHYDLCSINGLTVLDPTTSTFFTTAPTQLPSVTTIRPYPRKFEDFIMSRIKDFTLTVGPRSPPCKVQHNAPALVFAAGGYTGNFWHDFNDGFIPLFITINTLLPDQDFVIVVSDAPKLWVSKYADLLHIFTKHPIITLGNVTTTHCFPSAKIGLITHGFMTINQTLIPNSKTFLDFRELLGNAYNRRSQARILLSQPTKPRARLVLASRSHATGRKIMNQAQVVRLIKKVGFEVVVFEPKANTSLHESYALLNSSHAFVGAENGPCKLLHLHHTSGGNKSIFSWQAIVTLCLIYEDDIICCFLERAQFAHNPNTYDRNAFSMEGFHGSLVEFMLMETEKLHAQVGRYKSPDEHPFFPEHLPEPLLPPLHYPQVLHPCADSININNQVWDMYFGNILPSLVEQGDDGNCGSAAVCDTLCLQALSKRIHYGLSQRQNSENPLQPMSLPSKQKTGMD